MLRKRASRGGRGVRLRRALAAIALIGLGLSLHSAVAPAASGVFSLDRLRLGGSAGPEDYLYTAGNVIYPDGGVDPGSYYKFVVTDAGGAVHNPAFPCTAASGFSTTDNTYTVLSGDPVSTGTSWKYTLQQFLNSSCTGAPAKTLAKNFYVAKATAYADSALTTSKAVFGAGQTAYVVVSGMTPSSKQWSTTWILPSSGTACANTAGSDLPDSTSAGRLPSGTSFLQYRPNTTGGGDLWNRESKYEVAPCPAFGAANEGAWQLRLQFNATSFVVLPAFSVDATPPPAPTIGSAPTNPTNSGSASFTFSDAEAGVSFLCQLDGGGFSACTSPKSYSGLGDGSHTFQVKARDSVGNDSAVATFTWNVDTAAPVVTLTQPANGSQTGATPTFAGVAGSAGGDSATVTVKVYSGSSAGGTPVQTLVASRQGDNTYSVVASPALSAGTYTAQTEQSDNAGNVGKSSASTFTVVQPPLRYRDDVLADNPLSYWRLGEASGTTAADEQGAHPGTYAGSPTLGQPGLLSSDPNTAVRFDGLDDKVSLGDLGLHPSTVEFWISTTDSSWWRPVYSNRQEASGVASAGLTVGLASGKASVYNQQSDNPALNGSTALNDGRPHQIVYTYDRAAGLGSLYVDGVLDVQASQPYTVTWLGARVSSIGFDKGTEMFFAGTIDEVAVYGTALSGARVLAHYQAGT